jgi:hypothetical protein
MLVTTMAIFFTMAAPSMSKVYLVQSRVGASSKGILAIIEKDKKMLIRLLDFTSSQLSL